MKDHTSWLVGTTMKIINVRLGLATNSSSTHSIIFLPKDKNMRSTDSEGSRYGWDYFHLADKASKLDYLATSLMTQLQTELGEDIARSVVNDWCKSDLDFDDTYYVDHQSTLTFPRNWDGKGLDRKFFDAFKEFIVHDDIVIAGGNDNDDERPYAIEAGGRDLDSLPVESYSAPWVARQDHDYWTIFNRDSGAKIRLALASPFNAMPRRSTAPELIDIKITDYCPFNCEFCYQDSTLKGAHADYGWLQSLAFHLGDQKVFEVALGGGEPTLHPKFVEILAMFRYSGVVPNFTTKNLGWLKDEVTRDKILKYTGAFAYSAQTAEDVRAFVAALPKNLKFEKRVTIQHVVGVVDADEFKAVLEACADAHFPITLLGYKMVGRGPAFSPKTSSAWLNIVKEVCERRSLRVGIDTALADDHWDDLKNAGISEWLLTRIEGQFSCYIDAVAKTINTSSYTTRAGSPMGDLQFDIPALYADLPHQ